MKKRLSQILTALCLLVFMIIVALYLWAGYHREQIKSDITRVSVELQEIQKKYAENKIDEARQQWRTLKELLGMQTDSAVLVVTLPPYARVSAELGFHDDAKAALTQSLELTKTASMLPLAYADQICFIANIAYTIGETKRADALLADCEKTLSTLASPEEKGDLCVRLADSYALQRNAKKLEEYRAKADSFMKLSEDAKWKMEMENRLKLLDEIRGILQQEETAKTEKKEMTAQERLDEQL